MHLAQPIRPAAAGKRPGCPVDEHAARAVAACYLDSDDGSADPLVRAAYQQLEAQTDALLQRLVRTWPGGLRVVSTALGAPYDDDDELLVAVSTTRTLEIPTLEPSRRHPLLGSSPGGPCDRLRALHDLLGHVLPGFGFDRDGEFTAWLTQDRHHTGLARRALATELHAQHSVLWSTGQLAEPKATLIDTRILRASASAMRRWPHRASGRRASDRADPALRLRQRATRHRVRERASELAPRADGELREHLAKVVLGRWGTDEALAADLRSFRTNKKWP
jgi:hypothetical protein